MGFGTGPEVAAPQLTTFLSIFDCLEYSELYRNIEDCLLAAFCLVTYIVLQVNFNNVLCFFGCFEYSKYPGLYFPVHRKIARGECVKVLA